MTRKQVIVLVGIFGVAVLLTVLVFSRVEVVKSAPMNRPALVERLQDEDFGLGHDLRFTRIHEEEEEMVCEDCHTTELVPADAVFFEQDVSPESEEGPVNRNNCRGCHEEDSDLPLYRAEAP